MYKLWKLAKLKTVINVLAAASLISSLYFAFYGGLGFILEPRNYGWVNGENILFCSSAVVFIFSAVLSSFIGALQKDLDDNLAYLKSMLSKDLEK